MLILLPYAIKASTAKIPKRRSNSKAPLAKKQKTESAEVTAAKKLKRESFIVHVEVCHLIYEKFLKSLILKSENFQKMNITWNCCTERG